jgi:hypothetical protein
VNDQDLVSNRAAKWIRAHGLSDLFLMLIEVGKPLGDVFAQLGYLVEPMLDSVDSGWVGFLRSLGQEDGMQQFISDLRGEGGGS